MHPQLSALILLLLFIASGFFSGAETALFSLSKIERRRLDALHPHLNKLVSHHLNHPRRTLMTLLIGNILVNTLASAFATLLAIEIWGDHALTIVITGYTVLLIIFCEIIPKILAARMNIAFASFCSLPLRFCGILFHPFIIMTQFVTDRLMSLVSTEPGKTQEGMSEEELKTLVKIGEEEGVFDRQERYMMQKLFELGERPVKEIMIPRFDMVALDIEDTKEEHLEMMKKYHFTHFPVYKDSPDHILGVISVQQYLLDPEQDLRAKLHQPLFVPEAKRIDDLLDEFRMRKEIFCICVDEHGGTAGLVTLEDILEEIFGEYYDEYEKVQNPIRPFGHGEYQVDAKIPMNDFNEFFNVEIEPEEAATLGGYIMEQLGEVPKAGKILTSEKMIFRIQTVVRHRIIRVIVRKEE